ncbi:hypothetical protein VPH35_032813 [Triticum aestivum]|uniref:Uncharacterized protein n=1 Tax=Triticum turgidum subsp. durum TaxID=4567 RepID=A0A9R1Q3X8_TRITD|nr:unnamed protein product [Triticum turgidum subsp. durum]
MMTGFKEVAASHHHHETNGKTLLQWFTLVHGCSYITEFLSLTGVHDWINLNEASPSRSMYRILRQARPTNSIRLNQSNPCRQPTVCSRLCAVWQELGLELHQSPRLGRPLMPCSCSVPTVSIQRRRVQLSPAAVRGACSWSARISAGGRLRGTAHARGCLHDRGRHFFCFN